MWNIFVFVFTFVVSIQAAVLPGDRIVGGTATTVTKYPFIAQIERLGDVSQVWGLSCGASILTPSALLSAAHCLEANNFLPTNRRIRAGSAIRGSGGTVVNLENRINYPDYAGVNEDGTYDSIDHDIAIIFLIEELVYTNVIQPATIISHLSQFPPDGVTVTTIGWGRTVFQGPLPDILQEVQNHIFNQEECHRRYVEENPTGTGFNTTVTEHMICAGISGVGGFAACNGDSGGPLLYLGTIVGVVSWSFQCADPYYPDVHARVSTHTNWILETVSSFESAYINNTRHW